MRCTGVAPSESGVTAGVLQAKTGLVSLGHFTPGDDVEQVVVAEGVHAVVVSDRQKIEACYYFRIRAEWSQP